MAQHPPAPARVRGQIPQQPARRPQRQLEAIALVVVAVAVHRHVHGQEQHRVAVLPGSVHQVFRDAAVPLHVQLQPEVAAGRGAHVLQQGRGSGGQHERQACLVRGARQMHVGLGPEQAIQAGWAHDRGHGGGRAQNGCIQAAVRHVHQHVRAELHARIGRRIARQCEAVLGAAFQIIECQPGQPPLRVPPVLHHAGKHVPSLGWTAKWKLHFARIDCISIILKIAIRDSH
ncbi:hypothetical protein D3C72_1454970 [compost metagenome]